MKRCLSSVVVFAAGCLGGMVAADEAIRQPKLSVRVGVAGRETLPNAFELHEPVRFLCYVVNNSAEQVAIKQRPAPGELVYVITTPDKKERLYDPVKEWHGRAAAEWGIGALSPAEDREFEAVAPGKAGSIQGWVGLLDSKGHRAVNTSVGDVPGPYLDESGEYAVRVRWSNDDERGWTGHLESESVRFEVLSTHRIEELEKGLAITRLEAQAAAQAAAEDYFAGADGRPGIIKVKLPLRLFVRDEKKHWEATFYRDNGRTRPRPPIAVIVDGETGRAKVRK
jgi:hypothetical protein